MSSCQKLLPALALALCLCACGGAAPSSPAAVTPGEATAQPVQSWKPGSVGRVDADEAEAAPRDGLEGSYYNDYLRMLLQLDGSGGCTLTGAGVDAVGSYVRSGDHLTLDFGSRQETVTLDGDGDAALESFNGLFLRDWDKWSITAEEAAAAGVSPAETELLQLGGGKQRWRDYTNEIAFTFTEGMEVLPGRLAGAVAASDGAGGYVTGRNVTALWAESEEGAEAFLERFIRTYTFADYAVFYGEPTELESLQSVTGKVRGRLAAATGRIRGADTAADIRVILYTSAYPDGTENQICKCYLAPAGDAARLKALESTVTDMAAVRMRQER